MRQDSGEWDTPILQGCASIANKEFSGIGSIQGVENQSLKCCQNPLNAGQAPVAWNRACAPSTFAAGL